MKSSGTVVLQTLTDKNLSWREIADLSGLKEEQVKGALIGLIQENKVFYEDGKFFILKGE